MIYLFGDVSIQNGSYSSLRTFSTAERAQREFWLREDIASDTLWFFSVIDAWLQRYDASGMAWD